MLFPYPVMALDFPISSTLSLSLTWKIQSIRTLNGTQNSTHDKAVVQSDFAPSEHP